MSFPTVSLGVVTPLMATFSSDARGCAFPLGCGFCGSPKRVGQGREPLPSPSRPHAYRHASLPKRRRPRRDGFTQKAVEEALWLRPECTIPFSGRRGRRQQAWPEWRKGRRRGETRRSVGLWLGPAGEPASDCPGQRNGCCACSLFTYHGCRGRVPALLVTATSPAQSRRPMDHMMTMASRGTADRRTAAGRGGISPDSGSSGMCWPFLLHLPIDTVKIYGCTSLTALPYSFGGSVTILIHFGSAYRWE